MGPSVGKRKLVYSTSRKNDRNANILKRRRIDDSSDSSNSHGYASSDSDEDISEVRLRQTVNTTEIETARQRDQVLERSNLPTLPVANVTVKRFENESSGQIQYLRKLDIRKRYMAQYRLPAVLYASELIEKATPLLGIVKDMYRGVVDSHYKFQATRAFRISQHGFLSTKEFRNMDLTKFTAGFYGMKRQIRVGEEILKHHKPFLLRRQGNTMKWWGVADFANYVLAPEVLTSLCIQEMHLGSDIYDRSTRERAYELFASTTEFGLLVADSDPLEPWETALEEQQLQDVGLDPANHGSYCFRKENKSR